MYVEQGQLKKFILDSALVSKEDVEIADAEAQKQKKSLGDVLVAQGKITDDAFRRMQAYVLGIPFVDLKARTIPFEIS